MGGAIQPVGRARISPLEEILSDTGHHAPDSEGYAMAFAVRRFWPNSLIW